MKILFYSNSSTMYGAPSSLLDLVRGIRKLYPKIVVKIILPSKGALSNELLKLGIDFKIIPYKRWIYNNEIFERKKKSNYVLAQLWRLKHRTQKRLVDSIYFPLHLFHAYTYHPDLVYINSSVAPMGARVAKIIKVPVVWHHREVLNDPDVGFNLDQNINYCKKLFLKTRLHIFPSSYLKKEYSWLENRARDHIQYNGVYFIDQVRLHSGRFDVVPSFGMVGRINEQKGQEDIIMLFTQYFNNIHLHLFGEGKPEYIEYLKSNYNGTISYNGFGERNNIYSKIDYLIVNAKNESFGRVVAEANAHGIPCIGVSSGALPEIIRPGVNGYLYNNITELREILSKILLNNAEKMEKNSKLYFEKNFSIENYTKGIMVELFKLI